MRLRLDGMKGYWAFEPQQSHDSPIQTDTTKHAYSSASKAMTAWNIQYVFQQRRDSQERLFLSLVCCLSCCFVHWLLESRAFLDFPIAEGFSGAQRSLHTPGIQERQPRSPLSPDQPLHKASKHQIRISTTQGLTITEFLFVWDLLN